MARKHTEAAVRGEDLSTRRLTPGNFPAFYRMLVGLRFPLDVADVIDLRDAINHSADSFRPEPQTPDYRQFVEALQKAIDSFGVEKKHHVDRLITILTMMRHFHYTHTVRSRDAEMELRHRQARNQRAYDQSVYYGLGAMACTIVTGIAWFGMEQPGWAIKIATFALAYVSWDYLHSLTLLSRESKTLTMDLNALLRDRVDSLNWKTLIHKLSLLLGFKRVRGVNVFLMNDTSDHEQYSSTLH